MTPLSTTRPVPASGAPAALVELSARLGNDPRLVQGGGGNTSMKAGDVFWVKASGTWLAHARDRDVFVRLPLADVRAAMQRADAEDALTAMAPPGGLRPSIETSLHALLPHPVVAHVHSVNAIAWAARRDAEAALAKALDGVAWAWVPYRRPGLPLTAAIRTSLEAAASPPDVLLLGNHGLVVGGADCDAVEARLHDVERRLSRPARAAAPPDAGALRAANDLDWVMHDWGMLDASMPDGSGPDARAADAPSLHAIATDPVAAAIAMRGALYPDHVVFLGERAEAVDAARPLSRMRAEVAAAGRTPPDWALVPGAGLLLAPGLSDGARAMLGCLADVALRCDAADRMRYLDVEDVAALMGWEAEAYRRARDNAAN